jgi:carbamoylphosphate synthase small subunit
MVLHAGIVCYEKTKKGKLVIYNTETKERITKDVMTVGPGDNSGVDELFKSIQSFFTAPKGCLCICLGNKYDSRKKIY